jgi:hypothetical protein
MNTHTKIDARAVAWPFNLKSNAEDFIKLNVYAILTLQYIYHLLSWGRFIIHPIQTDVRLFSFHVLITQYNDDMDDERRKEKKGSFGLHILKICRHRRLKRIGAATTTIRKKSENKLNYNLLS